MSTALCQHNEPLRKNYLSFSTIYKILFKPLTKSTRYRSAGFPAVFSLWVSLIYPHKFFVQLNDIVFFCDQFSSASAPHSKSMPLPRSSAEWSSTKIYCLYFPKIQVRAAGMRSRKSRRWFLRQSLPDIFSLGYSQRSSLSTKKPQWTQRHTDNRIQSRSVPYGWATRIHLYTAASLSTALQYR